jgi:hypothetical protein
LNSKFSTDLSLYEKYILNIDNYDSLSPKYKRAFNFTRKILGDDALMNYSSIETAYPIAREEYVKNNVPREDWDRYLIDRKPIFSDIF